MSIYSIKNILNPFSIHLTICVVHKSTSEKLTFTNTFLGTTMDMASPKKVQNVAEKVILLHYGQTVADCVPGNL